MNMLVRCVSIALLDDFLKIYLNEQYKEVKKASKNIVQSSNLIFKKLFVTCRQSNQSPRKFTSWWRTCTQKKDFKIILYFWLYYSWKPGIVKIKKTSTFYVCRSLLYFITMHFCLFHTCQKVRKNVNVLMRPSFQSIKSRLIVKLNDPGLLRYRIFSAISFPSTKFTCYTH